MTTFDISSTYIDTTPKDWHLGPADEARTVQIVGDTGHIHTFVCIQFQNPDDAQSVTFYSQAPDGTRTSQAVCTANANNIVFIRGTNLWVTRVGRTGGDNGGRVVMITTK